MENVNPQVVKAVSREIKELTLTPLEDISITFNELDLTNITANITGPGMIKPPNTTPPLTASPNTAARVLFKSSSRLHGTSFSLFC